MSTGHALCSPSGWSRWSVCAAAPSREAPYPEETSEAAEWGTQSHAILEAMLKNADTIPEGDSDQISFARACYDYTQTRAAQFDWADIRPEVKVYTADLLGDDLGRYCNGSADVVIVGANKDSGTSFGPSTLEIVDLKTGGWRIEADEGQLMIYALGALLAYWDPNSGDHCPIGTVVTTVFQPKRPGADGIARSCEWTVQQLLNFGEELKRSVSACLLSDPVATPGPDQCKFCKAKPSCKEYAEFMNRGVDLMDTQAIAGDGGALMSTTSIEDLTAEQLSELLQAAPMIKARIKDAEDRALRMVKNREVVPGFKLAAGKGSRSWSEDDDGMAAVFKKARVKIADFQVVKLKSPAQMEKLKLTAKQKEVIKAHIVRVEGKPTLVPDADYRHDIMAPIDWRAEAQAAEAKGILPNAVTPAAVAASNASAPGQATPDPVPAQPAPATAETETTEAGATVPFFLA